MNTILLQNTLTSDTINQIVVEEKTLSIMQLITSGGTGGTIIMSALALLSIFAVYILFERYSAINKASKEDENFFKSIKNFVEQKDIAAAKTLCQNTDNPIARMIEKGVDRIDKPMTDISSAIENQGKLEIYKMENPISAFGIYSFKTSSDGEKADIGNDALFEDYYLNFWKGEFLITLVGFDTEKETIDDLC